MVAIHQTVGAVISSAPKFGNRLIMALMALGNSPPWILLTTLVLLLLAITGAYLEGGRGWGGLGS